jgi:signal transduction histidine kinase/ActR/RegA family two-component response regulator
MDGVGVNAGLVIGLAGACSGAIMAALALAMSRAPGWNELRSFALVAGTASVFCMFGLVHVIPVSDDVHLIMDRFVTAGVFAYGLVWIRHLAIAAGRRLRLWERCAIAIGLVLIVLALIPGVMIVPPLRRFSVDWFGVTYTIASVTPLALVGVLFIISTTFVAAFTGGRRWREGWHARLPMLGASSLAVLGVGDTLSSLEILPIPQLLEAGTVVVVGVTGASYARRFIEDARRLEGLSTELERQVATRTGELVEAQAVAAEHQKLAALGRIAAGVAHEINNPTAVIQQNLELLRMLMDESDRLTPDLDARIDRSHAATKRISAIVSQLLASGRSTSTESTTVFAISPIVDQAIAAASVTARDLPVTVSLTKDLCARGEPGAFERVLINLLVNAAHATQHIVGTRRVSIEGRREGERVRLHVSDNGGGIPPAIRDRLFEPFATSKPVGQGTGLGLAVSRGLMTRQGGTLQVAKTSTDGTEMQIELPAADVSELQREPGVDEPREAASPRHDIRVLVIEDNEDVREVMTLQLERFFHVAAVATVEEGLAKVSERAYDVVLCDVMMPTGGADVWLARSSVIDPKLDARTILITGGPTSDAASALLQARARKVLYKPVDVSALRRLIERTARE